MDASSFLRFPASERNVWMAHSSMGLPGRQRRQQRGQVELLQIVLLPTAFAI